MKEPHDARAASREGNLAFKGRSESEKLQWGEMLEKIGRATNLSTSDSRIFDALGVATDAEHDELQIRATKVRRVEVIMVALFQRTIERAERRVAALGEQ